MEIKELEKLFTPDYTPYSMFKEGIFQDWKGYFRPVYSHIAKKTIKNDYKEFDWGDLPLDKLICNDADPSKNKYGVSASLSLEEWESNGWILSPDYRGWIQWFCNYYAGRRIPEVDAIQIKRWLGVKKRFGKIKNKTPKIKQLLLNWAIKA